MNFDETGLDTGILRAVAEAGYQTPTPIQEKVIPLALAGKDVIGIAQTGTGKTASFALPALHRLIHGRARARMPRVLILEPTRELAAQVVENLENYGKHLAFKQTLLIGGLQFGTQTASLKAGTDILIATPGRLLDHVSRGNLLMGGIEFFIIDEADRMLDMGFIPDIQRIEKLLPHGRQTMLFSATMPDEIGKLANQFLTNPERVEASRPATVAEGVQQKLVWTKSPDKIPHLTRILKDMPDRRALIFCNRKRETEQVQRALKSGGLSRVATLHGDMNQHLRMRVLAGFRNKDILHLIASDVAARGLDIPQVAQVVNYDVPTHAEDYIHRIGRTGRAGAQGTAWTLALPHEEPALAAIETLLGVSVPLAGESAVRPSPEASSSGGGGGRGGSGRGGGRSRGKGKAKPKARAGAKAKAKGNGAGAGTGGGSGKRGSSNSSRGGSGGRLSGGGGLDIGGGFSDSGGGVPAFLQRAVPPRKEG